MNRSSQLITMFSCNGFFVKLNCLDQDTFSRNEPVSIICGIEWYNRFKLPLELIEVSSPKTTQVTLCEKVK